MKDSHQNRPRSKNKRKILYQFIIFTLLLCFLYEYQRRNGIKLMSTMEYYNTNANANNNNNNNSNNNIDNSNTTNTITTNKKRKKYYNGNNLLNINNININQQSKLEYIHIPKTGGTFIEYHSAIQGNKTWGICHYNKYGLLGKACYNDLNYKKYTNQQFFNNKYLIKPTYKYRKNIKGQEQQDVLTFIKDYKDIYGHQYPVDTLWELWHTPPSWLKPDQSPYTDKTLFTVVRNPYTKLISEFYCPFRGYAPIVGFNSWKQSNATLEQFKDLPIVNVTPDILNHFILKRLKTYPVSWTAHYVPQAEYVYDYTKSSNKKPKQVIHHVIKYENLTNEFNDLMKQYNISVHLLSKDEQSNSTTQQQNRINEHPSFMNHTKYTILDLNATVIALINTIYKRDFELFHYTKLNPNLF